MILVDVNECDINNGGCEHNCENTEGSYKCSCLANYFLNRDGHTCTGEFLIPITIRLIFAHFITPNVITN